jgi:hypothetical protein
LSESLDEENTMANARKRSPAVARKRVAVRKKSLGTARTLIARIESELPKALGDYVSRVERELNKLERHIERAGSSARKRATRLLRDASKQLGAVEARGEAAWQRLTAPYRKDAVALLERLENAIGPTKPARKPARRRRVAAR